MSDIIHNVPYDSYYHDDANGVRASGGLVQRRKFTSTQHAHFVDGQQVGGTGAMKRLHETVIDLTKTQAEVDAEKREKLKAEKRARDARRRKQSEKYRQLAADY